MNGWMDGYVGRKAVKAQEREQKRKISLKNRKLMVALLLQVCACLCLSSLAHSRPIASIWGTLNSSLLPHTPFPGPPSRPTTSIHAF